MRRTASGCRTVTLSGCPTSRMGHRARSEPPSDAPDGFEPRAAKSPSNPWRPRRGQRAISPQCTLQDLAPWPSKDDPSELTHRCWSRVSTHARTRTSGNCSGTTSSRVIARGPPERRPRRLFVHTCGREHLRAGALAALEGHPAGCHAEGLGERAARLLGRGAAHRRSCHPDHESASSDLPPRPGARPHSDLDENASRYRANRHPTSRKVTQRAAARHTTAAGNRAPPKPPLLRGTLRRFGGPGTSEANLRTCTVYGITSEVSDAQVVVGTMEERREAVAA